MGHIDRLNSTKNATIRVSFRTSNDRLPQHVSVYGSEFNVAKQRPGEELLETAEIRYDVPVPQGMFLLMLIMTAIFRIYKNRKLKWRDGIAVFARSLSQFS